jgi:hypothetical protein
MLIDSDFVYIEISLKISKGSGKISKSPKEQYVSCRYRLLQNLGKQ